MLTLLIVLLLQDPAKLVDQLGADAFRDREQASQELRKLGWKAVEALDAQFDSADPEVRMRVHMVLSDIYADTFHYPRLVIHEVADEETIKSWKGDAPPAGPMSLRLVPLSPMTASKVNATEDTVPNDSIQGKCC